ncbi:hypothetical protein HELRODRAFT_137801, partial [Helobdella robusta]|uniref:RING-type domain-containing protein n=1 Tax=Helobdella robusta TaxID=6412 RepID=T1EIN4_HELRO
KVQMQSINQFFICSICNGYLHMATTITECLHTFCKGCLIKHLEYNLHCPKCLTIIHPTDPKINIRHDSMIQDLLYKVLP